MSPDEMRARLMEGTADGTVQAGIVDDVVQAYADALGEIGTHKARVDELTKQVGTLTDTNLWLLEKVRYAWSGNEPSLIDPGYKHNGLQRSAPHCFVCIPDSKREQARAEKRRSNKRVAEKPWKITQRLLLG